MSHTINLEALTFFISESSFISESRFIGESSLSMPEEILKFILEGNEIVSEDITIKLRLGRDYAGAHHSSELSKLEPEDMYPVLIKREGMFRDHNNYVYSRDGKFIDRIIL